MADKAQLAMLKRSVIEWNRWRMANPDVVPDLQSANLRRAKLQNADLRAANLYWADFTGAKLQKANLHGANLQGANLQGAELQEVYLQGANLTQANLKRADLQRANLQRADLQEANLQGANLQGTYIERDHFQETNLQEANLQGADLQEANLYRSDFTRANLKGANLTGASLYQADLQEANLTGASLYQADLQEANLTGASLYQADLRMANFQETYFQREGICQTIFQEAAVEQTIFADIDLSGVIGLETVQHIGPSRIDVNTLYKSHGKIHEAFLRGCGVPDNLIENLPSLTGAMQPIQFHSCFISYSTKDGEFVRRLHSRMQQEHLRVWFAPEDLKGGDKLRDQLHQAIQLHDKFLLILSDASMASSWVAHEVGRAFARERKEQRRILFPIGLKDFDSLKAWSLPDDDTGADLAKEIRRYYIPDFSTWKDQDAFEVSFARLLNDLKTNDRRGKA